MNATQQKVLDAIRGAGEIGIGHGDPSLATPPHTPYNTIRRVTQELRAMGHIVDSGRKNEYRERLFTAVPVVADAVQTASAIVDSTTEVGG